MKEITRIHIAKVAYDSETEAKKALESYLKSLQAYANDDELLADIEIRMTELLAERGVRKDGIITLDDITAIKEQLGEPSDFMGDGDIAVGDEDQLSAEPARRYYRDMDNAVLGGVIGGVASFLGVNPLWLRLIAIVLFLISFGTATLVYAVLWLVVPAARTAAQRLQLQGRPVTIKAIRELSEREGDRIDSGRQAKVLGRIVTIGLGVVSAFGALTATGLTIFALFTIFGFGGGALFGSYLFEGWMVVAFWLAVTSGLLLAALFIVGAYAAFMQRLTKRIIIIASVIAIAGAGLFASAVGISMYVGWQESARVDALRQTSKVALPSDFSKVKRVSISAHSAPNEQSEYTDFMVTYVVSPGLPRYTLESFSDTKPEVTLNGDQARIVLKTSVLQNGRHGYAVPQLTIYGPALDELTSEQGKVEYSSPSQVKQDKLVLRPLSSTAIEVSGTFGSLQVIGDGTIDARLSTIYVLTTESTAIGMVKAGVVEHLSVTQPVVCSAYAVDAGTSTNHVAVRGVTSGEMTYNGTVMVAQSHSTPCGAVQVGGDDDTADRFED